MFPRTFILYVLPPSWTGPCLIVAYSFSNPSFASFADLLALLLCHSVIHAMLLFDSCLLGFFWACCMLNSSGPFLIQVFMLFFFFFGLSWPIPLLLGSLGSSHPFGHPQPIPILYSHGPLLSLLGFPGPNYHILYF